MNILFIQLAKLGDIFQSSYSVEKMRRLYPQSKIYFLCSAIFSEAAEFLDVDEIIPLDLDKIATKHQNRILFSDNSQSQKIIEQINSIRFDIAVNLNIAEFAEKIFHRINAREKFGYYSQNTKSTEWLYFVLSFIKTRKMASINLVDVYRHSFKISDSQIISRKNNIPKENYFCFSLGTGNLKRNWAVENFVKLTDFFSKSNLEIYLIGSEAEADNGRYFQELYKGNLSVKNFIGKTSISDLVKIISKSKLLISGDTGPMHVASYFMTPTIAIFSGPAYPFETAGYFSENRITSVNQNLECYPCSEETICRQNFSCNKHLTPKYLFDIYDNNADFYRPIYDEIGQFLIKPKNNSDDFIMKLFYRDFALRYFFNSTLNFEKLSRYYSLESSEKSLKKIRREIKIYTLTNSESADSYFLKPYFYLEKLLPNRTITDSLRNYLKNI